MDTVQMLGIAAAVLGVAVLVLVAMFISTLRAQQRTARQAARRALEDERRRRALSDLMPRSDPDRKPRKPRKSAAASLAVAPAEVAEPEGVDPGPTRAELLVVEESILRRERELEALRQAAGRDAAAAAAALAALQQREAALSVRTEELAAAEAAQRRALAELAGLSADEARAELMAHVERESRLHAAQLSRDLEAEARRHGEAKARQIIVGAIQR
ncbi:MAG: Rnase Y domain-containing protein, partial [Propionicimonas sp.]